MTLFRNSFSRISGLTLSFNHMIRRICISISLCLCCCQFYGQALYKEGYILNSPLDTIHGQVKYISYNQAANKCVFKTSDGEEKTYLPADIYGYGIENALVFHSRTIPDGEQTFMEVIYQGTTKLYAYRDTHQRNFFFIESNETGEFRALTQKTIQRGRKQQTLRTYIDVLKIMLPRSELVADEIESTPLTAKGLSRLLIAYDERYANTQGIIYSGLRSTPRPRLGILAGGSFSKLTLNGHNGQENSNAFSAGLRMEKEVSRNTGRLFINVDLMITTESYSGSFDASQQINTTNDIVSNFLNITLPANLVGLLGDIQYRTMVELDRTTLNLPINLKYKLPGQKFNVTFGGGLEFQYATSDRVLVDGQILQNGVIEVGVLSVEEANPFRIGMNMGLGISYNAKRTIFLDLRHSPAWFDQGALNYSYTRAMLGIMLSKNR